MTELIAKKTGKYHGKNSDRFWLSVEKRIARRFGDIIPVPESMRHVKQKFAVDCLVATCEGHPEPVRFFVDAKTRNIYILDNETAEIVETL
jgi:hypothetical protein